MVCVHSIGVDDSVYVLITTFPVFDAFSSVGWFPFFSSSEPPRQGCLDSMPALWWCLWMLCFWFLQSVVSACSKENKMLLRRNKANVLKITVWFVVIFVLNKVSNGKCEAFCSFYFSHTKRKTSQQKITWIFIQKANFTGVADLFKWVKTVFFVYLFSKVYAPQCFTYHQSFKFSPCWPCLLYIAKSFWISFFLDVITSEKQARLRWYAALTSSKRTNCGAAAASSFYYRRSSPSPTRCVFT